MGGAARLYAEPANVPDLQVLLRGAKARGVPVYFLGRGSNLLVPDEGVDGLVIHLGHESWSQFEPRPGGQVWVGAGLRLKLSHAQRDDLAADPSAKIVVVTHGLGIDFLLQGATNQMEQPFAGAIADLANKGVEFRVCNNTLVSRKIAADKVAMEAKIVPSGVAEVAKLQAREGFVYLRP